VMHAMGNVIDMRRFGGLRRIMSVTHWTFLIGCLALAGIFPFAGFWSKDAIVGAVHDRAESLSGHSGGHTAAAESSSHGADFMLVSPETAGDLYHWFYYAALLTALLTAFYTFRAFYMTFYGPLRTPPEAHGHAHESPPVMTVPLIVLAMFAVTIGGALDQTYVSTAQSLAGGVTSTGNSLSDLLGYTPQLAGSLAATRTGPAFHTGVAAISLLLALAGIGLAAFFYLEDRREVEWLARFLRFQWTSRLLDSDMYARVRNRPWVVSLYRQAGRLHLAWLVTLAGRLAALLVWIISAPLILTSFASPYRLSANKFYLDELYDWTIVRPLRWLAAGCYAVDRWLIDGLVNLCGQVPVLVGGLMRSLQMGLVQFYALSMALGVLLLVLVRVLWG
jgi:NADH-quinone oxidoreductase subunit L